MKVKSTRKVKAKVRAASEQRRLESEEKAEEIKKITKIESEETLTEEISEEDFEGFLSSEISVAPDFIFDIDESKERMEEILGVPLRTERTESERDAVAGEERTYLVRGGGTVGGAGGTTETPYRADRRTATEYLGTRQEPFYGAATEQYIQDYTRNYEAGIQTAKGVGELERMFPTTGASQEETRIADHRQQIEHYTGRVDVARDLLDLELPEEKRMKKERRRV